MSYLKASSEGYLIAEQSQQVYINESMRAYREAKKEIDSILKDLYLSLGQVSPDEYFKTMQKYGRYAALEKSIVEAYNKAAKVSGKATIEGLRVAIIENYNRQNYLTQWLAPESRYIAINEDLVEYTISGNAQVWKKIQTETFARVWGNPKIYAPQAGTLTDILNNNRVKELNDILRTIQNGLLTGKSYAKQSEAVNDIIGSYLRTKTGEQATGAMYNALRVARTEGNRVLNNAALANAQQAESQGLKVEKEWMATFDKRTRSSHGNEDGQRVAVSSDFTLSDGDTGQAPGQMGLASNNINCRCTTIAIVNNKSPEVKKGKNPTTGKYEVVSYKSYNQWLKER